MYMYVALETFTPVERFLNPLETKSTDVSLFSTAVSFGNKLSNVSL
jgi:hypothetical protein